MAKFHIGKKIREVQKASGIGPGQLAQEIGVTRNVVYNIFKRKDIRTDQLFKVCQSLHHNFFQYYDQEFKKGQK
jgi:DNA-binding Xre family transcriptional regulator